MKSYFFYKTAIINIISKNMPLEKYSYYLYEAKKLISNEGKKRRNEC